MRINCTSVEESKHVDEISKKVQNLFPNYKVVVIPNKYITEKGRKEVLDYSRKYHQANREREILKQRERHHLQRIEKSKKDGIINDGESFNVLINTLSNNIIKYFEDWAYEDGGISDVTYDSHTNEIFKSNIYESVSCYTDNTKIHKKIFDNVCNHINNSKFDGLSKDDTLRETAKVVIKSLKEIKKEQKKLHKEEKGQEI